MASEYNIADQFTGDSFSGMTITVYSDTAQTTPLDLTSATARMDFRKGSKTGQIGKQLTTGSGITISDAVNGVITIDRFTIDFSAGEYLYDLQVTLPGGVVETVLFGRFTAIQDVTQ